MQRCKTKNAAEDQRHSPELPPGVASQGRSKCGKPTTPSDSRLNTHDGVNPDDRGYHCEPKREAVPKTQMVVECLAAMYGIG
jgi:hypothetical protein